MMALHLAVPRGYRCQPSPMWQDLSIFSRVSSRRLGRDLDARNPPFAADRYGRVRVAMNDCFADVQPARGRSERLAALEKLELPVWVESR